MKITDRYILKNILPAIFISLSIFLILFILVDLFGRLDEIIKSRMPLFVLLEYYANKLPYAIVRFLPFSVLIAILYGFCMMNKKGEIGIILSCGISKFRVALPIITVSIIISVIGFLINEFVSPSTYARFLQIEEIYFERKGKPTTIYNVTKHINREKMLFVRTFNVQEKILQNVIITEYAGEDIPTKKTTIQKALWDGNQWKGKGIHIFIYTEEPIVKEETSLNIGITPENLLEPELNPETASIRQLRQHLHTISRNPYHTAKGLVVDLYSKYSIPFTSMVLAIIACSVGIKYRRTSAFQGIGIGIVIGLAFYIVFAITVALGRGGFINPVVSAFLPNIIFLILSGFLFKT
jgi:lipopolysaccharide export system permease protein